MKRVDESDYERESEIPLMYGICRNDMGVINPETVLQSSYLTQATVKDSEAIDIDIMNQIRAILKDEKVCVHSSISEEIYDITEKALHSILLRLPQFVLETCTEELYPIALAIRMIKETYDQLKENGGQGGMIYDEGIFKYRMVFVYEDLPVETVEVSYLKLYSLSLGESELGTLDLNGMMSLLTNCAWFIDGTPIELENFRRLRMRMVATGSLPVVSFIGKLPRLLQHIIPDDDTKILETSKVSLGARLATGTVVMPDAAYINFNTGPVEVEDRTSNSDKVDVD